MGENNRTLRSELELEGSGRFGVLLTGEINCKSLPTGDGDRKCCCTLELDGRRPDVAFAKVKWLPEVAEPCDDVPGTTALALGSSTAMTFPVEASVREAQQFDK